MQITATHRANTGGASTDAMALVHIATVGGRLWRGWRAIRSGGSGGRGLGHLLCNALLGGNLLGGSFLGSSRLDCGGIAGLYCFFYLHADVGRRIERCPCANASFIFTGHTALTLAFPA
jgi:hypothetical protein